MQKDEEYQQEKHLQNISRQVKELEEFCNHPDRPNLIGSWEDGLTYLDIPALEYDLEIFKRRCSIDDLRDDYGPGRYFNNNKLRCSSCNTCIISIKSSFIM